MLKNAQLRSIGELCIVGDGAHASIPRQESGVEYLTSRNFKNGQLDRTASYYISEDSFERHFTQSKSLTKPQEGDLVFSIIGTIGHPYVVKSADRFGISSSVALLRPRSNLDPHFLHYWILGPIFQAALNGTKGGVAQGYVSLEMIRSLPVPEISLREQMRIVDTLSAYDDLIENSRRRIKILEEMARALYREWFVLFRFPGSASAPLVNSDLGLIPKGWETRPVSQCLLVNPKITMRSDGEKPFLPMGSLSTDSMLIGDIGTREGNSGSKFQNGDTLFARITPCLENGKTGFVQFLATKEDVAFGSTEFIVLRSKTLTPEYVYLMARSEEFRANAIKSMSGASGRQRVQERCFESFVIPEPPQELLFKFSKLASPMFKLIQELHLQIQNLKRTRNLLLPRLFSAGE